MTDLVLLGRYPTALDAHFARGLLAREGIPALVDGEATGTAWGFPMGVGEGIRLVVRSRDYESAVGALAPAAPEGAAAGAAPAGALPGGAKESLVSAESPARIDPRARADGGGESWARSVRAFAIALAGLWFAASIVPSVGWPVVPSPIVPLVLTASLLVLLRSRRARSESSAKGRRYLAHAWVVVAFLGAMVAVGVVVAIASRR